MAFISRSLLEKRVCLQWKTELPYWGQPRHSPVFSAMNSEWFLKITYVCDEYQDFQYYIYLINKKGLKSYKVFRVTTYVENERNYRGPMLIAYVTTSKDNAVLWYKSESSVKDEISDFQIYGKLTFVCIFHTSGELVLPPKKDTGDKSVQVFLEYPLTLGGSQLSLEKLSLGTDPVKLSQSTSSKFLNLPALNFDSLSEDFGNFLDQNLLPDVQLKCEELVIPAHKFVLAARSKVFFAMFQHQMAEKSSSIVDVKDIDPAVLGIFIKYLYCGKVPDDLTEDMVPKLYACSDKYAVHALTKVCSLFMANNLTDENFLDFLLLSDAHSDKELKEAIAIFVTEKETLLTNDAWIDFSYQHPRLANEIYKKHIEKTVMKEKKVLTVKKVIKN